MREGAGAMFHLATEQIRIESRSNSVSAKARVSLFVELCKLKKSCLLFAFIISVAGARLQVECAIFVKMPESNKRDHRAPPRDSSNTPSSCCSSSSAEYESFASILPDAKGIEGDGN
jgi:hypothetical protein